MDIREVKAHLESEKKKRGQQHLKDVLGRSREERIQPFTDKQWDKIRTRQKSSFAKGKSAAYNSVWNHHQVKIA